ncbi:MAG: EAL domain-containing protein [Tepidisphaera sp.]|nr:EAL domain-containing protein [Tepidisphaera sp.]
MHPSLPTPLRSPLRLARLQGVARTLAGALVLLLAAPAGAGPTPADTGTCTAHEAGFVSHFDFFTNFGNYMPRVHCMSTAGGQPDWPWIISLIGLTLGIVIAYARIFVFWRRAYLEVPERDRNNKLMDLAYIFLWCAICGYAMSIIMFFWPAYRLLAIFLVALNWFSWRFAANLRDLKVSLSAKALQRQLDDALAQKNRELEQLVAERTHALAESEAKARKLATVARRTDNTVIIADAMGRIEWVNDGFSRLTGYTLDEVAGKTPGSVLQGPESDPVTIARMRAAIGRGEAFEEEIVNYSKQGQPYWVHVETQPVRDEQGRVTHFIAIERETTQQRRLAEQLRAAALTDKLTGLANREALVARLGASVDRAREDRSFRFAVLFIDFDRFKLVNDSMGHRFGDMLLVEIGQRLCTNVRASGQVSGRGDDTMVARFGGDEFVIVLDALADSDHAARVANRLLAALAAPYKLEGHEIFSGASIGIVTSDLAEGTPDDVLRDADTAMYEAKTAGKGRYVVFDASMRMRVRDRMAIENDLRSAIANRELRVHYQPIVALYDGSLESVEALVRWEHPTRGLIPPSRFIPIAEESGLILDIGDWVLREACRQLAQWRAELGPAAPPSISVNLARQQLLRADIVTRVRAVLEEFRITPERLHLEITESEIMHDERTAVNVLHQLKELGVKIDMDDFGTGYSSLACLRQFPIDVLKIDRAFVAAVNEGRDLIALLHSVTQLARNLGIRVVAEGIEDETQLALLQSLGCDFGQGYYFSRPVPPEKIPDLSFRDGTDRHDQAA